MTTTLRYFILTLVLILVTSLYAQSGRKQVAKGNQLFSEEKYDEANNAYRDALLDDPESDIVQFNIGDTQYKKKKYEEALKEFKGVLDSEDILLQSKTYYNMGNTFYRLGKLPESILSYKRALELNPDDLDAKYNLEFVRKKLKDQAQKQPQDGQQQQQQQQQQGDQQEKQEEQQQQQEQSEQEQQNQEQQQEEQTQQGKESEEDISKEDAERILDALKESEKELKDARKQKGRGQGRVGKDW